MYVVELQPRFDPDICPIWQDNACLRSIHVLECPENLSQIERPFFGNSSGNDTVHS